MNSDSDKNDKTGWVYNIQGYSIQDGPGIRTTVFMKGCPLGCLWCSNPESQKREGELFYIESLCTRCDRCLKACPRDAIEVLDGGNRRIISSRCDMCGLCADACPNEAMVVTGKLMAVRQVLEEVRKDGLLYRNSGGGVTLSGGEPTAQSEFAEGLLRGCQQLMFHTCLDTCGYANWEVYQRLLPYVDMVLYDIKQMDSTRHKELTGVGNELILENARRIVENGSSLIIRFPMIPDCNDSEENLKALGEFARKIGVTELDVLPYHQLGRKKYDSLGMEYRLNHLSSFSKERVAEIVSDLQSIAGSNCEVKVI